MMPQPTLPQEQSPLFATLPLEIRRVIYQQLWLDCGPTQHLYATTDQSFLLSFPCILSPAVLNQEPGCRRLDGGAAPQSDAPDEAAGAATGDEPQPPQAGDDPGDIDGAIYDIISDSEAEAETPDSTPWCAHSACFSSRVEKWNNSYFLMYSALYRRYGRRVLLPDLRGSAVLTTFVVCKRMYQEASESLYSRVRFSFTNMLAMDTFLSEVPRALTSRIQFVDVRTHIPLRLRLFLSGSCL
jgi:hypothetical protein